MKEQPRPNMLHVILALLMGTLHQPYSEAIKIPLPIALKLINAYAWIQKEMFRAPATDERKNRTYIINPEVCL